MEFVGKNIQGKQKEDTEKEVSEKINKKQKRKGDSKRRSEMHLMKTDIIKKAKAKEFYPKSGAPLNHLQHASFPYDC